MMMFILMFDGVYGEVYDVIDDGVYEVVYDGVNYVV